MINNIKIYMERCTNLLSLNKANDKNWMGINETRYNRSSRRKKNFQARC